VYLNLFSASGPPLSLIYLCGPLPFIGTITYEKKSLYFHVVDLYIRIHLYYCYLQYYTVFKFLFMYNTLFTYTSRNILLIIGIIFNVLLGPDEDLQVFECLVAVWSVISQDHLSSQHQGGYVLLTADKSPY
jgi:hypothetical protein